MAKAKTFISYSHKDDKSREELEKWLVVLKDQELIDTWFDGYMLPGDYFKEKIFKAMDESDVIILLLSQDYLSSDFCKQEMDYAFAASKKKIVIPIILKPCTWLETANKDVLALPKNGKAVSTWQSEDEAWHTVFEGMKRLVDEFQNNFETKDDFLNEIEYVEFVTQNKRKTRLSDIFVFPNLMSFGDPFEQKSIEYAFFTNGKKRAILIRGRETSGKSALLRWLYMNFGDEYSPLLLDGNNIQKRRQFDDHFQKEFYKQLSGDFDLWMKRSNKVALIDNFTHNISYNIFEYLDNNFAITIITMDDEEYLLYFKDEVSVADFSTISLGQFDLAQQEELIRKWFVQSEQGELQEISDIDIDKLETRVNNVITQQRIVPRYPFYILSILQSFESFMPDNIRITAYGHCYQALVTAQLVRKNIKFEDID